MPHAVRHLAVQPDQLHRCPTGYSIKDTEQIWSSPGKGGRPYGRILVHDITVFVDVINATSTPPSRKLKGAWTSTRYSAAQAEKPKSEAWGARACSWSLPGVGRPSWAHVVHTARGVGGPSREVASPGEACQVGASLGASPGGVPSWGVGA